MNILVAYASKHGSTRQIAEVICDDLRAAGFDVMLRSAEEVVSLEGFDAVVLGSAIYIGQWHQSAIKLIDRLEGELQQRRVWLFSSGPIGEDPFPREEPPITAELVERLSAIEHQSFTGKLDRSQLGFGERIITTALRAPEGDFRDWDAIRAWAGHIATVLMDAETKLTSQAV